MYNYFEEEIDLLLYIEPFIGCGFVLKICVESDLIQLDCNPDAVTQRLTDL